MQAIELDGITRDFATGWRGAKVRALDGVTLWVAEGEVVGLLGPNGSGKSTLLKIVLGLLAPTAGQCRVFGVPSDRVAARASVGFLPETPDFPPHLTGFELVCFHARLGGMAGAKVKERAEEVIRRVGLRETAHRRVGTYSKGMRQRIGLAQALVMDPRLVILDEPTSGLDLVGAEEVGRMIRRLKARGRTVVLSSHRPEQVEDLCDRVAVLDHGRLVLQAPLAELARPRGLTAVLVDPVPEETFGELRAWLGARGVGCHGVEAPRAGLREAVLGRLGWTEGKGGGRS